MIVAGQRLAILIATKPVDFRCGHNALALIVQTELKLDLHSGVTVVFRSKRGDRLKILVWDDEPSSAIGSSTMANGMVLIYKVLEQGSFACAACHRADEGWDSTLGRIDGIARNVGIFKQSPNCRCKDAGHRYITLVKQDSASLRSVRNRALTSLREAFALQHPEMALDKNDYVIDFRDVLLPQVAAEDFEADLNSGDGNELQTKFRAVHSSSALAVNCFAPFRQRIADLTLLSSP